MNAERARAAYRAAFGDEPALFVRAPGRVNLIGEHTDYNDGFVLPCAIDRDTVVAAGPAQDGMLDVIAADFGDARDRSSLAAGFVRAEVGWADYVRAMAAVLAEAGVTLPGARLAIAGDVPLGSGLSSSASLEIAAGAALAALAGRQIDAPDLAKLAQRAENVFVGCQCGIMDQLISARGVASHAMLIDCRSLACVPVALPPEVALIIAHSGVRHSNVGGEYNERRLQCERAAAHFGVEKLRDLDAASLERDRAGLDDVSWRRARHVVTENARVIAMAEALGRADLAEAGRLMRQSHASMRDDFEITVPAIDRLADIMNEEIGPNGGARMTGGGFGGCVIGLATRDRIEDVRAAVAKNYCAPDGLAAEIFLCKAVAGLGTLTPE